MVKKVSRIVFDTNIIISALLFKNGRLSVLREYWATSNVIPLVSTDTAKELVRVLQYPKFKLSKDEQQELLADYLPFTEIIDMSNCKTLDLPICRDLHDQQFLELAYCGKADFLVTGDSDLLDMKEEVEFSILAVSEWLKLDASL